MPAETHWLEMQRKWAPMERGNSRQEAEFTEARNRAAIAKELGWTEAEINAYFAGFIGALEWWKGQLGGHR